MASNSKKTDNAAEIDRLALSFAKEPKSKVFIPLAEEYGKAGMWEEAAAVLEDGLKVNPGFITAMVALGRAYEQLHQPIKATAILEEAVKVSPDNLRAHRTLAKLYAAQGAKDAALRSCNVILAMNPRDQEALSLRAGLGGSAAQPEVGASESFQRNQADQAKQEQRFEVSIEEDGAQTAISPSSPLTENPKSAQVVHLEEWLRLIQTRRRDSRVSSRSRSGS